MVEENTSVLMDKILIAFNEVLVQGRKLICNNSLENTALVQDHHEEEV